MIFGIRLMADFGLSPIYVDDEGEGYFFNCDEQELVGLVPQHVVDEVNAWDALYQATFDRDDPASSAWARPEDRVAFLRHGREVAQLLRRHLPTEVRLEYCGDDLIPTERC